MVSDILHYWVSKLNRASSITGVDKSFVHTFDGMTCLFDAS